MRARRGPGLRARLTLLATGLAAAIGMLLLWLGWLLVGEVVAAVPVLPRGATVVVDGALVPADGLANALRDSARAQVLQAGSLAFLLVVFATAVLSWAITGQVLRPLHDVTATARRLSAESLGQRLRLPGPRDEVAELADTFDEMLDRLQASFDVQRRFVANASHELRTPLAVMRTELDVTLADPGADVIELRRMADVLRSATLRAEQLVEGLLVLARTEGAELRRSEPVDLAVHAATVVRVLAAESRARGLLVVSSTRPAPTVGDPALLERVVANLVENAVRHNVDGGWVRVSTDTDPLTATSAVTVASSGDLVPADSVVALFEPFRRGGVARTAREGAGLGLSIVLAVARAHGGTATAMPVDGGGLVVTVTLPAPPTAPAPATVPFGAA